MYRDDEVGPTLLTNTKRLELLIERWETRLDARKLGAKVVVVGGDNESSRTRIYHSGGGSSEGRDDDDDGNGSR